MIDWESIIGRGYEQKDLDDNKYYLSRDRYRTNIDLINYDEVHSLAEWQAGHIDHALSLYVYICQRFNWKNPNLNTARIVIEKMLQRKL
ncbi:hypothetical protein ACFL1R_03755 [Candidatus Latescibacterota bacterium]